MVNKLLTKLLITGKIATILYAIFGIPLMLLYLTNIGGILAKAFRFVYGKFCTCKPPAPSAQEKRAAAALALMRSRSLRQLNRQRSRTIGTLPSSPVTAPAGVVSGLNW